MLGLLLACGGGGEPSARSAAARGATGCGGTDLSCDEVVARYLEDADEATIIALELDTECGAGRRDSCRALAFFLLDGEEVEGDRSRARGILSEACDARHGDSCLRLGQLRLEGEPNAASVREAIELLDRACRAGAIEGCDAAGALLERGRGVDRDVPRALGLFERGCDGGLMTSCERLADHHTMSQDSPALLAVRRRMCEAGEAASCHAVGLMLERAEGAAADLPAARAAHERGCDGGDPAACTRLGQAYARGELDVTRSDARAFRLFEQTCERDHPAACAELGIFHEEGRHVPEDVATAITFFEGACERRDGLGCLRLGRAHMRGRGVPYDPVRAATLFREACDSGERPSACHALAEVYREGRGVEQNQAEAFSLFHSACDAGHPEACVAAAQMLDGAEGVRRDRHRAAAFRERACQSKAFPDVCPARTWTERTFEGRIAEGPRGRGSRCDLTVPAVLEPGWCRLVVTCSGHALLGEDGTWVRCDASERGVATTGPGGVELDTASSRARIGEYVLEL